MFMMVEILTGLLVWLLTGIVFGNTLLYFGEDSVSPLMKTLLVTLISLFIACICVTIFISIKG